MPMRPNLPIDRAELVDDGHVETQKSYNGDRILVNKYIYTVSDPERWDVVVFKFPGNAQMNYIKRLVGLPGETIRVFQGDLFTARRRTPGDADFTIARKPADKVLAMRQLVHDTDYDPAELYAGRLAAALAGGRKPIGGWKSEVKIDDANDLTVGQRYSVDAPARRNRLAALSPLRAQLRRLAAGRAIARSPRKNGPPDIPAARRRRPGRSLITDFNAYNTRVSRRLDRRQSRSSRRSRQARPALGRRSDGRGRRRSRGKPRAN